MGPRSRVLAAESEHADAQPRGSIHARAFLVFLGLLAVVGSVLALVAWDLGSYEEPRERWRIENGEWVQVYE